LKPRSVVLIAFFFFLSSLVALSEENLPKIAVLPIQANNISEADAEGITKLFEKVLLGAEVFNVIEQYQVKEILKDQGFFLTECTEEKCAIVFGRLLHSDYIIVGMLSNVEGMYMIHAGIVDVVHEETLKTQKLGTDSLLQIEELAEVVTYKLMESVVGKREYVTDRATEANEDRQREEKLVELRSIKGRLEQEVEGIKSKRKRRSLWAWISLGAGVGACGFAGYSWYASDVTYNNYLNATLTEDVLRYRDEVKRWDTITYISGGIGIVGLGFSAVLWLTSPKVDRNKIDAIKKLEAEIQGLERPTR